MEESATACVTGDFAQGLEKAKEAVSTALFPSGPNLSVMSLSERQQKSISLSLSLSLSLPSGRMVAWTQLFVEVDTASLVLPTGLYFYLTTFCERLVLPTCYPSAHSGQEGEGPVQAEGTPRPGRSNKPRPHLCCLLQPGELLSSEWHEEGGNNAVYCSPRLNVATGRLLLWLNQHARLPAGSTRVRRNCEEQAIPTGWTTSSQHGQHLLRAGKASPAAILLSGFLGSALVRLRLKTALSKPGLANFTMPMCNLACLAPPPVVVFRTSSFQREYPEAIKNYRMALDQVITSRFGSTMF